MAAEQQAATELAARCATLTPGSVLVNPALKAALRRDANRLLPPLPLLLGAAVAGCPHLRPCTAADSSVTSRRDAAERRMSVTNEVLPWGRSNSACAAPGAAGRAREGGRRRQQQRGWCNHTAEATAGHSRARLLRRKRNAATQCGCGTARQQGVHTCGTWGIVRFSGVHSLRIVALGLKVLEYFQTVAQRRVDGESLGLSGSQALFKQPATPRTNAG